MYNNVVFKHLMSVSLFPLIAQLHTEEKPVLINPQYFTMEAHGLKGLVVH